MSWFGFGKKKKWADVLPMLYPFDLDTDCTDSTNVDDRIAESNRVGGLVGPLGLRIYLLDQAEKDVARMVSMGMLREWGIGPSELLSESILNLEKYVLPNVRPVKLEDCDEEIAFVDGAGSYTSSLVLSEKLFSQVGFKVDEIALAIPHRELLFFGDCEVVATTAKLREIAEKEYAELSDSVPSKHLLLNGIARYDTKAPYNWSVIEPV
jgi:hypothetical protein